MAASPGRRFCDRFVISLGYMPTAQVGREGRQKSPQLVIELGAVGWSVVVGLAHINVWLSVSSMLAFVVAKQGPSNCLDP